MELSYKQCHLRKLVSRGAAWMWPDSLQTSQGSALASPNLSAQGLPWIEPACAQPAPYVVQLPRSPGLAGPVDFFCLCCRRLSPSNCSSTLNTPHINELPCSSYQLTKPPLINRLICSVSWPSISLVAQHIHLIFWELCSLQQSRYLASVKHLPVINRRETGANLPGPATPQGKSPFGHRYELLMDILLMPHLTIKGIGWSPFLILDIFKSWLTGALQNVLQWTVMFWLACKTALVSDRVVYEEGLTFADPACAPDGLL